jgi:hypothetical protein
VEAQRIIENALGFLARVDLKGNEAPALMQVVHFLQTLENRPTVTVGTAGDQAENARAVDQRGVGAVK